MKKRFLLFVFSIIIHCHNNVAAQSMSVEETKTILCGHKWLLKTLEQDNKAVAVPEKLQGIKMVFKTDGYAYRYLPSQSESDKARMPFKWSITRTTLTLEDTGSGKRRVNIYSLTEVAGMKLKMTLDEAEQPTFVFEQAEKTEDFAESIADDDYYGISSPERDSMTKKLFARINQEWADRKIFIGSWDLEKISFKNIATKPADSNEGYTAVFKKALLDAVKEVNTLTEADKNQLDLDALALTLVYFGSGLDFKDNNKLSLKFTIGAIWGRYTIASGSLKMNWDNGNEENPEIVKINSKELVLKDKKLKVTYYYKRSE